MHHLEDSSTSGAVTVAIIGYSLCSSTLLLANKMAVNYLPLPAVVSFIQILSSAVIVIGMKFCGAKIDNFEWAKVKAFTVYIVAFVLAIYANMQALSHSNVETVIVFRACTPISVCIIEYFFMDRDIPSTRSLISLVLVALSAVMYCLFDSEFILNGFKAYYWVSFYFVLITFEMTYGKNLANSVKMDSVWGPVLYCNVLAVVPMFAMGYLNGDFNNVFEKLVEVPANGVMIIVFSCIVGTLIGYTGWLCRSMVSATTYTLVGVANKFLTVILNIVIWDKHSSQMGQVAVVCCLIAGSFYQQAPKKEEGLPRYASGNDLALLLNRRSGQ